MKHKRVESACRNTLELDGAGFDSRSRLKQFAFFYSVFINYPENRLKIKKKKKIPVPIIVTVSYQ